MQTMTLEELTQGEVFISDISTENTTTINGNKVIIGRYAEWSPLKDKPGHMIIEVGNDLAQLQQKYNISDSLVFKFLK